jgi:hypothetical protein
MARSLVFILLFALTTPAFAKHSPPSCGDLWSALTDTLRNERNYTILASDTDHMRASFVVVGSLFPATHAAFVKPRPNGCSLEINMHFTGNDDESALRVRVDHALAKRRKTKPSLTAASSEASR